MTGTVPPISAYVMQVLTGLLEARTGQQLAAYRSWRLDIALKPILRDHDLASLDELVETMIAGDDPLLADRIVDALINSESSFFRDAPVFEMILEACVGVEVAGRRPRVWIAGCEPGQEPL